MEFCSSEFDEFFRDEGIARHRTVRHTTEQNGVAERMNRTLLERGCCMLQNASLSKDFWAEAVSTTCYLVNQSPASAIDFNTTKEIWSGNPQDYSNLRVFSCRAYFHIDQGKLEPRVKKCIFLGYASGVKGYRLRSLDSKSPKLIIERNVTFNESALLRKKEEITSKIDISIQDNVSNKVEFEDMGTQQPSQM